MEILLWLLPAVVTTGVAMAVAAWLGRDRPADEAAARHETPSRLEVQGHPGEGVSPPRPARSGVRESPRSARTAPSVPESNAASNPASRSARRSA